MVNLSSLIDDLLKDIETSCTEDIDQSLIVSYVREILCVMTNLFADQFSEYKILELSAGATHTPECRVTEVHGQTNADGSWFKPIAVYSARKARQLRGLSAIAPLSCLSISNNVQRIDSVQVLSSGKTLITMPPLTKPAHISVACAPDFSNTDVTEDIELPNCVTLAAIKQWVLYRFYNRTADDEYTIPRATGHLNAFLTMTNLTREAVKEAFDVNDSTT